MKGYAMKKQLFNAIGAAVLLAVVVMASGCSKDSPTSALNTPTGTASVNMNISFSKSNAATLMKTVGTDTVGGIQIDSAVVVLARIKFESDSDTVRTAPMQGMMTNDMDYMFRGPFVIHVRDTIGINFANANLPAGTYTGIKFWIHQMINGEMREDSDMRNHRRFILPDSSFAGASITVWGTVVKNGTPTAFKYEFNGEVEFKIAGTFVVANAGGPVNIAMNFNIASFFVNTKTGAMLDPTDMSFANRELIRQAIYAAFGAGRCGRDRGDGRPW